MQLLLLPPCLVPFRSPKQSGSSRTSVLMLHLWLSTFVCPAWFSPCPCCCSRNANGRRRRWLLDGAKLFTPQSVAASSVSPPPPLSLSIHRAAKERTADCHPCGVTEESYWNPKLSSSSARATLLLPKLLVMTDPSKSYLLRRVNIREVFHPHTQNWSTDEVSQWMMIWGWRCQRFTTSLVCVDPAM